MKLITIGLNHKTAPVEIREKFAFPQDSLGLALAGILEIDSVRECAIVSTCNRVELYAVSEDPYTTTDRIKTFLAHYHESDLKEVEKYLYSYRGLNAVRHLFRVSSSLDSMVLGEPQILGQVKDSYEAALKFNTLGPYLNKVFPKAFSVAKRTRNETKMAMSAVSVSFAAVELAKKIFSDLGDKSVMIIGAGEMCELAARHLQHGGATSIFVTNRTFERAVKLANEFEGTPVRFEEFKVHLKRADIVVSSTGAMSFLITREDVEEVIRQRRNRPMFFIDMAVPRDIDPEANSVDNVYLYDIDDLQTVVEENIEERQKEAKKAEAIVTEEVEKFKKWFESYQSAPIIVELRKKFDGVRKKEVEKAISAMKGGDEKTNEILERLSLSLMNKFLHHPLTALKKGENVVNGLNVGETVKKIFDLMDEEKDRQNPDEKKVEK